MHFNVKINACILNFIINFLNLNNLFCLNKGNFEDTVPISGWDSSPTLQGNLGSPHYDILIMLSGSISKH